MMATQAYYDWVRAGRRFDVCTPIANIVSLARRRGVAVLGTIGNEDHLRSNNPQDHTPFSNTAWPNRLPGYVVTACDLADGPHVDRIIADAKSGRAPWIKYINARGKQWNVKNGWNPVPNSDYHCHLSARTDQLNWTDPTWDPFSPNGSGDDVIVDPATEKDLVRRVVNADERYLHPTLKMERDVKYFGGDGREVTMPNALVRVLTEIHDGVITLTDNGAPVAVDGASVADALMSHPEFISRLAAELATNLAERLRD